MDNQMSHRASLQVDASWAYLAGGLQAQIAFAAAELEAMADGAPAGRRKLRALAATLRLGTDALCNARRKASDALLALDAARETP